MERKGYCPFAKAVCRNGKLEVNPTPCIHWQDHHSGKGGHCMLWAWTAPTPNISHQVLDAMRRNRKERY